MDEVQKEDKKGLPEPGESSQPDILILDEAGNPIAGMGQGVGERFVQAYFPEAVNVIRIATSYFSLRGYNLARPYVGETVKLRILVGRHEAGHVTEAITKELNRELGQALKPLHDAVSELVQRIDAGQFIIGDAGETLYPQGRSRFHCKFYICDDQLVWSGSANFSFSGLSVHGNVEQVMLSRQTDQIGPFTQSFEHILARARNVMDEVRDCLWAWLDMSAPYDVYLKVLHYLYGRKLIKTAKGATLPTYFQEAVIGRAQEQVERHRGALLLVATGLGKTIIGAETASRLFSEIAGSSVILLAPKAVKDAWTKELRPRGIDPAFFDTSVAFRRIDDRQIQAQIFEDCLGDCTSDTVILIDEAHRYRKVLQKQSGIERRNRDRPEAEHEKNLLQERLAIAAERGARIILLTATPYGTTIQDIRGLLHLLPPTAEPIIPDDGNRVHWRIERWDETTKCETVTILSLMHVLRMARDRGDVDPDGRLYVAMPTGSKQYWPKRLLLHRVKYPLPLESEFCKAFQGKAFSEALITFDYHHDAEDRPRVGAAMPLENIALWAWMSSPEEFRRFMEKLRNKTYVDTGSLSPEENSNTLKTADSRVRRRKRSSLSHSERLALLEPLTARISTLDAENDLKFARLVEILEEQIRRERKAIIFVERYATAWYLETELRKELKSLIIECTIRRSESKFDLKTDQARRRIIHKFAPDSNRVRHHQRPNVPSQVLVCTDADGIGLDLQDADVIINFDLPMSADELLQRAGRILRMSARRDRVVDIYTFVPTVEDSNSRAAAAVNRIIERLDQRQRRSVTLLGGCLLPPDDPSGQPTEISLATAEDIDKIPGWFNPPEDALQTDPVPAISHRSVFSQNEKRAGDLPQVLMTARETHLPTPHVVMLVEVLEKLHALLYRLDTGSIVKLTAERLLEYVSCTESEPKAAVPARKVEQAALDALDAWHRSTGSSDEQAAASTRLCVVYLEPRSRGRSRTQKIDGIFRELTDPIGKGRNVKPIAKVADADAL